MSGHAGRMTLPRATHGRGERPVRPQGGFEIASRVRDCGNGVLKLIYILQNLFALFIFYSFIIFSPFSPLRGAGKK